jgi:hypothetical protein
MSLSEGNEQASASSDYGSQGSIGLSSNARDEIAERDIAQKENRAVRLSKTVMFLVLLLFCAAAATVTYIFTKQGQENDFSTEVSLVLLALVLAFNRLYDSLEALVVVRNCWWLTHRFLVLVKSSIASRLRSSK